MRNQAQEALLPTSRHEQAASQPDTHEPSGRDAQRRLQSRILAFLTSKHAHYFVIILVTLDVAGIFAEFLISLHMCEHNHIQDDLNSMQLAKVVISDLSLLISCLFMVELLASIYAFGSRYFRSAFHIFDATTIVASFLVDVLTHGPVEEAGSLIIVLRLFRVFKIIEESGTVAQETIEEYDDRIKKLKAENETLRRRLVINS